MDLEASAGNLGYTSSPGETEGNRHGGPCLPVGCGPVSLGCAQGAVEGGVSSSIRWWLWGEGY